jgi:oxygen-dependent protoporphyrinogen oxidase
MPRFRDLERRYRSLILGLRATAGGARTAGARYALFVAPEGGMQALVTALAQRLPEGAVRLRAPVDGLAREGARWRLAAGGEPVAADAVVVAAPSWAAARLLGPLDPELGRALDGIEYASSATVTLAYDGADVGDRLRGFGFVVPAAEGMQLIACTYASRKFPGRAPAGHELVRGFLGGALRPETLALDDAALAATVQRELQALTGIAAAPLFTRVRRYPRSMPQYAVGHLARVEAIEARVARLPDLALAGAAYRGVGIPDCVRGGEAAADALLGVSGG